MAEQNTAGDGGQTPTTQTTEMVPLQDASDTDIEAFLGGATQVDHDEQIEPDEDDESQFEEEEEESEEDGEEPEPKAPAKDEPTKQSAKPEQKEGEAPTREEDAVTVTKREWQKTLKMLEQQEQFIKERSKLIGDLRKELKEANAEATEQLETADSTVEAIRIQRQIDKNQEQLEVLDAEEKNMTHLHESQKTLAQSLTPEEANLEGMAETLEADGVPAHLVQQFRQNPYAVTSVDTLIQLGKRQKQAKDFARLVRFTKKVLEERDQLRAKPTKVLQQVQKTLKQVPSMTGGRGGTVTNKRAQVNVKMLPSMSDAELDALLQS